MGQHKGTDVTASEGMERRDSAAAGVQAEHPAVGAILARAEAALHSVGERILTERLHRVLDQDGSGGLMVLSTTLLPSLRDVVAALPQRITDSVDPAATQAVHRLGTVLQEHDYALDELVPAGIALYDRLLHDLSLHLRESDRAVVEAVSQLNRALLTLGGDTLLAYCDQMTASLSQIAHTDSLTGLSNRRYFELRFEEELQRAQRTQRELALILLDVDGLKTLNDSFGHAAGDELLRIVAAVLRGQARGIDVAARLGGDEFALLLPETGHDGARTLTDRLRLGLADQRVHERLPQFSAGVAVFPDDGAATASLMEHADTALYQAKRSGE